MIASARAVESPTWHSVVKSWFSVSLDQGAVFYLALFAVVVLVRAREKRALLFVSWILAGYAFWLAGAIILDRSMVKDFLRVLLAAAAGLGAHYVLLRLDRIPRIRGRSVYSVGLALLPALSLPWAFPFWWNPVRMDAVYVESFEAVSREHLAFGDWIREATSQDAVFLTGPSYGPWIPALSGRRVLLADDSDPERRKAREWIAASRDPERIRSAAERFHVTHLAWGRLDALDPLAIDFEFLESSPLFSLVHQQRRWVRVFELRAPTN
jgi:hypothetical protein